MSVDENNKNILFILDKNYLDCLGLYILSNKYQHIYVYCLDKTCIMYPQIRVFEENDMKNTNLLIQHNIYKIIINVTEPDEDLLKMEKELELYLEDKLEEELDTNLEEDLDIVKKREKTLPVIHPIIYLKMLINAFFYPQTTVLQSNISTITDIPTSIVPLPEKLLNYIKPKQLKPIIYLEDSNPKLLYSNHTIPNMDTKVVPIPISMLDTNIVQEMCLNKLSKVDDVCYVNNVKQEINTNKKTYFGDFQSMCLELLKTQEINNVMEMPLQKWQSKETVFIEFRELLHCEFLIRNCISKLGSDWSHTMVCTKHHFEFYKNMCDKINPNIRVIPLPILPTQNEYNNLLLTTDFWQMFGGEKLLIYQSDSFIFKNLDPHFLTYDYVGAPYSLYKPQILAPIQVGNGGVSLRSKITIIRTLQVLQTSQVEIEYTSKVKTYQKKRALEQIPEDIVFSQNIQTLSLGSISPYDIAEQFCIDSTCNNHHFIPFSMHCMWNIFGQLWMDKFHGWC